MDVLKAEKASRELDKFIDSQAKRKGKDSANLEAALERAADARRLEALRQRNQLAWVAHYRCLTATHLKIARDF